METRELADRYNRQVNYLRVSITDRCNLNCIYCRPANEPFTLAHEDILTYEEILRIVAVGNRLGITKVRVTGGEPLVRKNAASLLRRIIAFEGISDVSLTTNGVLLADNLAVIREAGVKRLNISLDTLNREKFRQITGRDAFGRVWAGLMRALEAGFSPVKLNVVVMRGINDDELRELARLSVDLPLHVRFIEYMPTGDRQVDAGRQMLSPEIKQRLQQAGKLLPLTGPGGGTAERFRLAGAKGEIGFISPWSKHFCATCNRLRLTADGRLLACLLSPQAVDIKTPLRQGAGEKELAGMIRRAVWNKPGYAGNDHPRQGALPRIMSTVGG